MRNISVPLENTCYLKTGKVSSWAEARAQCWAWGGELALPLTSNTSTPNSWLQDDEEVWLGGGAEYHARPILSHRDQHFQVNQLVGYLDWIRQM